MEEYIATPNSPMHPTLFAFLDSSRRPDRRQLQTSIDRLGYHLALDASFDLAADAPHAAGLMDEHRRVAFELYAGSTRDASRGDPLFAEIAAGRDTCVALSALRDDHDLAAALIVSCALVEGHGAVISIDGRAAATVDQLAAALARAMRRPT